ncbi:MAG: hypothetical protein RL172_2199 [Bacteroidota bacterium]
MKLAVNIARIIVGSLFVFSGLVKAIDPLGLNYKMQEFFEVWSSAGYLPGLMNWFNAHALLFTLVMITLEVALGVALLIGWRKKVVINLLLLLMVFFTFLTSYVLFSGKIRSCGCFGDCIPLTPIQTFSKDILLLALILLLLFKRTYIQPVFKGIAGTVLVFLAVLSTVYLQYYVMKHLPVTDCLPYKAGNNILELRKMPADAIPDKFDYSFVYEKDHVKKEFTMNNLPDSSWKFIERKETLVQKGKNNIPAINDFSLTDTTGADNTEDVLNQPHYYLLFLKELDAKTSEWENEFVAIVAKAKKAGTPVYILTADNIRVNNYFNTTKALGITVFTCDGTAIKTAARANPTLFEMKGPVVQNKYSWADLDEVAITAAQ